MTLSRSSTQISMPNGLVLNKMPVLSNYSGDIIYVNSNEGNNSKGSFDAPYSTLAGALAAVTNDKGDIIVIKAGHAETITETVSSSATGFAIIGQGWGDNRPTFTNGLTGTDDAFDFDGDDICIVNIKWKEAASGTAVTIFNFSGDHVYIGNNYFELGAKTKIAVTHDTAAVGMISEKNVFYGTAAGCTNGIKFEAVMRNFRSYDDVFHVGESAGLDNDCFYFTVTGGGHIIARPEVVGLADGESLITETLYQEFSLAYGGHIQSASTNLLTSLNGALTPLASGFAFSDMHLARTAGSYATTAD